MKSIINFKSMFTAITIAAIGIANVAMPASALPCTGVSKLHTEYGNVLSWERHDNVTRNLIGYGSATANVLVSYKYCSGLYPTVKPITTQVVLTSFDASNDPYLTALQLVSSVNSGNADTWLYTNTYDMTSTGSTVLTFSPTSWVSSTGGAGWTVRAKPLGTTGTITWPSATGYLNPQSDPNSN